MNRRFSTTARNLLPAALILCLGSFPSAFAIEVLGTGTGALLGGDLTDPEDDGTATGENFNATFFATDKPNFTDNQSAFKIFTNTVVNDQLGKYCCSGAPVTIGATFAEPIVLSHFTLTSSGDSPGRDPDVYALQGSNDTTDGADGTWTDIYAYSMEDATAPNTRFHAGNTQWAQRNQVIRFNGAGDDFDTPAAYTSFRLTMTSPAGWVGGGGQTALAEMELFGTAGPTAAIQITEIDYVPDAAPSPTVTLTWRNTGAASYLARYSLDLANWDQDMGDGLTADLDEDPDDADHITVTFDLASFALENETDLFFRIEEE